MRHEVSPCSFPELQLQHHLCPGIQTINVKKCPPHAALQVRINCCIYPDLQITLLLSSTRTSDGACSVDNTDRGVLDTRTNPDKCGRANSNSIFEYVKIFEVAD